MFAGIEQVDIDLMSRMNRLRTPPSPPTKF